MPHGILDSKSGKVVMEGEPGFLEAKVRNLENVIRDLTAALVDVQHRLAEVDGRGVDYYPGIAYGPGDLDPH
ncbi:MAG: hypothetical protein QOJ29_3342 [Thermoleophilaceae bacterium]|jgi:hypothetical protein|nr:hypothetical protein [Thermoleophilaceae bacterium]